MGLDKETRRTPAGMRMAVCIVCCVWNVVQFNTECVLLVVYERKKNSGSQSKGIAFRMTSSHNLCIRCRCVRWGSFCHRRNSINYACHMCAYLCAKSSRHYSQMIKPWLPLIKMSIDKIFWIIFVDLRWYA